MRVWQRSEAGGVLASESETFTFFGCGEFSADSHIGASGTMGLSPGTLAQTSQLSIPKFSYCLTPLAERKTSPVATGPVQTTCYYVHVPLVGSGRNRLLVLASSLNMKPDGTIVDSGRQSRTSWSRRSGP
jgi:hypothetical protein